MYWLPFCTDLSSSVAQLIIWLSVCLQKTGLCFGLCFCASGFWACFCWYFPSFMIRSFPRLGTSCLHLTRSQESEKEIERERKREKERERERKRGDLNHLLVHQWIRSAIRDSQQPTSPIGFLFLKLSSPPCAVLLFEVPLVFGPVSRPPVIWNN